MYHPSDHRREREFPQELPSKADQEAWMTSFRRVTVGRILGASLAATAGAFYGYSDNHSIFEGILGFGLCGIFCWLCATQYMFWKYKIFQ